MVLLSNLMMLLGLKHMPAKRHLVIIIINIQGEILQIQFKLIRKKCLTKLLYGKLLLQYDHLNKSQIKLLFVCIKNQLESSFTKISSSD